MLLDIHALTINEVLVLGGGTLAPVQPVLTFGCDVAAGAEPWLTAALPYVLSAKRGAI